MQAEQQAEGQVCNMKKLFISQPMRDKTERNEILQRVKEIYPNEDIVLIDSFFENDPYAATPLWYLGKSLQLLSTADIVYFAKGWEEYRGCSIEHKCALEYGINIIHD